MQTRKHVERLDEAFSTIGLEPKRETCQAMKGLIAEGSQVISAKGDLTVRTAALIAAAQRVEHYEMAGYGSARAFAERLHLSAVSKLLEATLEEEGEADKKLTELSLSINAQAPRRAVASAV